MRASRVLLSVATVLGLLGSSTVSATVLPASSSGAPGETDGEEIALYDGADRDTPAIAEYLGVSQADAREYIDLQGEVGALQGVLEKGLGDAYGGLYIEPQAEFSVVVLLTEGDRKDVLQFVDDPNLKPLIHVEDADVALRLLRQTARSVLRSSPDERYDLGIDVPRGEIYLTVADESTAHSLRRELRIDQPARERRLIRVEVGPVAQENTDIYGGLRLDITTGDCTSGFTVKGPGGTEGITTAAHCGNTASYLLNTLPFKEGDMNGNQDVQWYSTPNFNDRPWAKDGGGTARKIKYWIGRSSVPIGALVCKYGIATSYKCGRIYDRDFAPGYINNPSPTFMLVHNDNGTDIAEPGDSGGPVYAQDVAYGIHSGSIDVNAIYMQVNYISSLDIELLLAPA